MNAHRRWAFPSARIDILVARQQRKALAGAMNFSPTHAAFIATTVSELARALLAPST
jgi:hypothetical protein